MAQVEQKSSKSSGPSHAHHAQVSLPAMDSESFTPCHIHASPHNVRIANIQNNGGPWIPCTYPGCIATFVSPSGLRRHSRIGKHIFPSSPQPQPTSAHLLQRFKPQLTIETPAKVLCARKPPKPSQPALYSDSEDSNDESPQQSDRLLSPLDFDVASLSSHTQHASDPSSSQESVMRTSSSTSTLSVSSTTTSTSSSSTSSSASSSASSLSTTHQRDNDNLSAASHTSPPNFMDVDTPPASSDNPMQSEDELPHRNQLQEDTEDSDGVPVSQMYHPLLNGIVNLLYLIFNY